jgi:hypothetical protein
MNVRRIVLTLVAVLSGLGLGVHAEELDLPLTDDAWINGNFPTKNFGIATTLSVHNYGPKFSLVRFDAATIAGKKVRQANLAIFVRSLGSAGKLTVYPIVSSWNESAVTWARQPPTEATAIADVELTAAPNLVEIDVTSVVQRWADGALPDAGFMLTTVEPIKAALDSKELSGGNPATLTVYTSDDNGPETFVLDLSVRENCSIDTPGYYTLDRTWWLSPHGTVDEPNAACGGAIHVTSSGVTLDLQGFTIDRGDFYPNYDPVLWIDTPSAVTLRNGSLRGVHVAVQASVAGSTVSLENIRSGGGVLLGNRIVHASGGSYSSSYETSLAAGQGSRVMDAAFACSETNCLSLKGSSLVKDCVFQVNTSGAPAIAVTGDDTLLDGNAFVNDWIIIEGNRNIVSRNFAKGGYFEVQGTGNILDGNIGPGIAFASVGNFYGNNRAKGTFVGTAGNTDWGGNVTY